MSFGNTIKLLSGASIPQIGLGTWLSKPHEVENAVEIAIRNGYRHLDLAQIYRNQDEVGRALKKVIPSVVKREDLWITSKLWNSAHQPEYAAEELDLTLSQIGTDYLDLYLIHWPVAFQPGKGLFPKSEDGAILLDLETSLVTTWKALINLQKTGKVKHIGVSNFTVEHLEGIIKATGVKPEVNQVEAHPLLLQDNLVEYCKKEGIHLTAYSPLGNNLKNKPKLTEHPLIKEIAQKLGATEAQVLIAWGAKRGYSVIPKSVQEDRIKSNFKQVELSEEDYNRITEIGRKDYTRFNIPNHYNPSWNINLFGEPEEATAAHAVNVSGSPEAANKL
ncbi:Aldo/keto reductase [Sistotremastrum niveocremeum HHB9708]|uniref:Aldo/keto reductase n=2 Tax=Sistotremastraceae TaxID=3402574 RepID=A0A164MWI2_9AGAM|nr:Aldo/keto reductase [Sistotremastrum niveocremeum HHB9708]KZT32049.1 Aldo/keto reductase [Sistotremastrum suecicum HHB10207 ss-3]